MRRKNYTLPRLQRYMLYPIRDRRNRFNQLLRIAWLLVIVGLLALLAHTVIGLQLATQTLGEERDTAQQDVKVLVACLNGNALRTDGEMVWCDTHITKVNLL